MIVDVLLASVRLHVLTQWQSPTTLMLSVVQPAVLATLVFSGGGMERSEATTVAAGIAMAALWSSTVWSGGTIIRAEVWAGTMSRLVTAPADLRLIIVGKAAGSALLSLGLVVVSIAGVTLSIGTPLGAANPLLLLAGGMVALASAIGLGLILGSLFVLTRAATRIAEVLMYPVLVFGGLLIPLSYFPEPLRWPASLISLHWARELVAAGAGGDAAMAGAHPLVALGAGSALTLAYFATGWTLIGRVVHHVRSTGTLEFA